MNLLFALILAANAKTVVAIIDTGADIHHPLIKNYILKSRSYNFADGNKDVSDQHGHGTHISGIIAQTLKENNVENVHFMVLKFFKPTAAGSANLIASVKAIEYAVQAGAHVINYSGGGPERSDIEEKAIKAATDKGILVVAASGNEKHNADEKPFYPASYPFKNIISVTAIDSFHQILPSSNFGKYNVHIAAPGKEIFSSLPSNHFGKMTGTSQATAFVTAALITLKEKRSDLSTFQKAMAHLLKTSALEDGLINKTKGGSFLKLQRSLSMKETPESLREASLPFQPD